MSEALLLGAGFSYAFAMPLIDELTKEVKIFFRDEKIFKLNEGWKKQGGGWNDEVVATFDKLIKSDRHYEQIAGDLQELFRLERDQKLRQEIHGAYVFLLECVQGLLLERSIKNVSFAISTANDFVALVDMVVAAKPLWIFSLNHDLIVEMLVSEFDIPLKTGFFPSDDIPMGLPDGTVSIVHFDRLSRKKLRDREFDFFDVGQYGINLIKIHGSLDIFAQGDDLNYIKLRPPINDAKSYISELEQLETINQTVAKHYRLRTTNEICYYDQSNVSQFLRRSLLSGVYKFDPRYSQIAPPEFLEIFKESISSMTTIKAIGYSFGDVHINNIINDWLALSCDHTLTIINPTISEPPFVNFKNQILMIQKSAAHFFNDNRKIDETLLQKGIRLLRERNRAKIRTGLLTERTG